jgi:enoyl-CoA hydratase/carnithine racemase
MNDPRTAPAPRNDDATEAPLVRSERRGEAIWLTLDRPQARNALSVKLMEDLLEALEAAGGDEAARAIVIAGAGPAFCAGHDLKELRATPTREFYETVFELCSDVMLKIVSLRKPVIARVHGIATAAGCQLVATCDLAVAADNARFATPGVNIGLFCSTPMVALSRNVARKQAMEMLLTGAMIEAEQAREIGLINRVAPANVLREETLALAQAIATKSRATLAIGKEAFYRQIEMPLADAYDFASEVMARNMLEADAEEGICAFIDKRDPKWKA